MPESLFFNRQLEEIRWLSGTNESGEVIPEYAPVDVTETNAPGGSTVHELSKPSGSPTAIYGIAGTLPGLIGKHLSFTTDFPFWVKVQSAGSLNVGDRIAPVAGQWYADTDPNGLWTVAGVDTTMGIANVFFAPPPGEDNTALVRVYTSTGTGCADVPGNAQCVWPGKLIGSTLGPGGSACPGTHFTNGIDVWIIPSNQCPSTPSVLKEGEIYLARLIGSWNTPTPTSLRPLYAITSPEEPESTVQIVKVAPLLSECQVTADDPTTYVWPGKIITLNAIPTASKQDFPHNEGPNIWIVALNNCNAVPTLKAHERYLAKLVGQHNDGANTYPLYAAFIGLEEKQEAYRFALEAGEDLSLGTAQATVVNPDGTAGQGIVTVEDPLSLFTRSGQGSTGWCIKYHDGTIDRYYVWQVHQPDFMAHATLTNTITGLGLKDINTVVPISPNPFNTLVNVPTQARNRLSLEAQAGDPCEITWDEDANEWFISAVKFGASQEVYKCKLTSDMFAGSASAIIYEPDGVTVIDAAATVKDPQLKFPRAIGDTTSGSLGDVALWNGAYYAIHLQQETHRLQGTLSGTLTGDRTETITVNNILPLDQSEWNLWDGVTSIPSVKNFYGHFGENGDRCELFWMDSAQEYRIDIVEPSGAIRVSSGDDMDYLENQVVPVATRDQFHDFIISFNFQADTQYGAAGDPVMTGFVDSDVLPGYVAAPTEFLALGLSATTGTPGFQELTAFTNTDERVKVHGTDVADYLDQQLMPVAAYVVSEDLQLRFATDTIGGGGSPAIMCFLDSTTVAAVAFDANTQFLGFLPGTGWRKMAVPPDKDEKVKVSITDAADYLDQQLMPTATYDNSNDLQFRFATDTIGGGGSPAIMCFLDATTTPVVTFDAATELLGRIPGTGWRRMVSPPFVNTDEKVKVNITDIAAYLDEQLLPETNFTATQDLQFYFGTATAASLGGSGGDAITCFLNGDLVPGFGALGSGDKGFLNYDVTLSEWRVDTVGAGGGDLDEKVKVNATDAAAFLDQQLMPTAVYSPSEDLQFRFATDTIGGGGSPAIMSFLDNSTLSTVNVTPSTELLGFIPATGWRKIKHPIVFACKLQENMGSQAGGPGGSNGANALIFSLSGTSQGSAIVWDRWGTGGLYSDAVDQAEGYCVYDGTNYFAIVLEQEIMEYRIQLTSRMTQGSTTASINWATRVRVSPKPFVRDRGGAAPTQAWNLHRFAADAGKWVTIRRNATASIGTLNRWLVVAAEQELIDLEVEYRLNGSTLEVRRRQFAMMPNEAPTSDWVTWLPTDVCP